MLCIFFFVCVCSFFGVLSMHAGQISWFSLQQDVFVFCFCASVGDIFASWPGCAKELNVYNRSWTVGLRRSTWRVFCTACFLFIASFQFRDFLYYELLIS